MRRLLCFTLLCVLALPLAAVLAGIARGQDTSQVPGDVVLRKGVFVCVPVERIGMFTDTRTPRYAKLFKDQDGDTWFVLANEQTQRAVVGFLSAEDGRFCGIAEHPAEAKAD